jgi:hypothetical protein
LNEKDFNNINDEGYEIGQIIIEKYNNSNKA